MSFQISQPEPTRVVLKEAVLIYERKGPYGSSTACYATQHPVRITEHGKAVIEEGRPLDALQIRSVIGQLSSLGRSASGITVPPQGTVWRGARVPLASSSASTESSPLSALLT